VVGSSARPLGGRRRVALVVHVAAARAGFASNAVAASGSAGTIRLRNRVGPWTRGDANPKTDAKTPHVDAGDPDTNARQHPDPATHRDTDPATHRDTHANTITGADSHANANTHSNARRDPCAADL
jgi:hypothetical protein